MICSLWKIIMNRCSVKYFCGSPACWNHFEAIETADLSMAKYKMVIELPLYVTV